MNARSRYLLLALCTTLPPGMTVWQPIDSGTGIDPPTDDRFPEDVRGGL